MYVKTVFSNTKQKSFELCKAYNVCIDLSVHLVTTTHGQQRYSRTQANQCGHIVILQEQNRRVVSEGVWCFSSDHSLHRCGQSVVQATTLLLAMQIVFSS